MGRTGQHTPHICSGTVLLSRRTRCPVWSRSSHVSLLDSQLNNATRLISGCVRVVYKVIYHTILHQLYLFCNYLIQTSTNLL